MKLMRNRSFLKAITFKFFKAQWLLNAPPALTYQNSAFCPQTICVFRIVLTINRDCFPKHH
jgi:hypothetical protein